MRADRLLAILLILQRQGQMTARQLAEEFEVSERTIYRDIDALGMAGVPVYGEAGPDGGYALLDNFRTFLTGLTDSEMQALFMLSIPQPLSELGADHSLKSALLKIFTTLPPESKESEEWIHQRFLLDTAPWSSQHQAPQHVQTIQEAVWQDRLLMIGYRIGPLAHDIEQEVMPLGLVAKAGVWYLVYANNERTRVVRIAALTSVRPLDNTFERPADYDLARFWKQWCITVEENRSAYQVAVRAMSGVLPRLEAWNVDDLPTRNAEVNSSWHRIDLAFESLEDARSVILGMGGAVEVLEPVSLRKSVADFAQQVLSIYMEGGGA